MYISKKKYEQPKSANSLKNIFLPSLRAYLENYIIPEIFKYLHFDWESKTEVELANTTKYLKINLRIYW